MSAARTLALATLAAVGLVLGALVGLIVGVVTGVIPFEC